MVHDLSHATTALASSISSLGNDPISRQVALTLGHLPPPSQDKEPQPQPSDQDQGGKLSHPDPQKATGPAPSQDWPTRQLSALFP